MMKSMIKGVMSRRVGIAVSAALMLASVATASASAALPDFEGVFPNKYTMTMKGSVNFATTTGSEFSCTGRSATGSITGAKAGNMNITFSVCKVAGECTSEGASRNQIKTTELEVTPVYISKTEKRVDLYLKPKVGTLFASCVSLFGGPHEIRGSVLASISPLNSSTKSFTLTTTQAGGKMEPRSYENEKGELVKSIPFETNFFGGTFFELGMASTSEIKTEHLLELRG
jgi:hypothetical protein